MFSAFDDPPGRRRLQSRRHPILVLLFLVLAFVGSDVVAQLERPEQATHGDLTVIYLGVLAVAGVIAVFEAGSALRSLHRKDPFKLAVVFEERLCAPHSTSAFGCFPALTTLARDQRNLMRAGPD